MAARPMRSLLQDRTFRRFWTGQTVSLFGDQIALLAVPLTAVLVLHAGAAQMGYLTAAEVLPSLLFSLVAGARVDRRGRRRRTMLVADLAPAVLMATIPIGYLLGILTLPQLYLVAFAMGTFDVLFFVSYNTLFVSMVPPDRYVEGNSLLNGSRAMSFVGGQSLAGLLVSLLTAPGALLLNGLSFVASAVPPARRRAGVRAQLRGVPGAAAAGTAGRRQPPDDSRAAVPRRVRLRPRRDDPRHQHRFDLLRGDPARAALPGVRRIPDAELRGTAAGRTERRPAGYPARAADHAVDRRGRRPALRAVGAAGPAAPPEDAARHGGAGCRLEFPPTVHFGQCDEIADAVQGAVLVGQFEPAALPVGAALPVLDHPGAGVLEDQNVHPGQATPPAV